MIRKYTFGSPADTGAVVQSIPAEAGDLPFFSVSFPEGGEPGAVAFTLNLNPEDILWGLGETLRGMNKRGGRYRSWNVDETQHTDDRQNIYASHNLLVVFGPRRLFAVYLDDPGLVTWDLGFTRSDQAVITSANGDLNLYLLEEESLNELARSFRRLTGRSYLPPRWAFGYIQSRWGYASEEDIRTVVAEHRKRHIPLDGVCMDIDYMEGFRNFTWNRGTFPDLKGLNADLRRDHVRLIPIIDAGVKLEEGYAAYDSGVREDAFCKKADGSLFVAAVWPGRCCFPDFLNPEARAWFGDQYRPLLEAGVEGFWNDMNEPSLFYSDEGLAECFSVLDARKEGAGDAEIMGALRSALGSLANSPEDYRRFYHRVGDRLIRHDKVHNLYGAGMTRATAEGLRRFGPEKRWLLFSRSSFVGAHRYGGLWQGDNISWWQHLKLALQMLPNMNLCGFLFCGCDLGGFAGDTTEDLLARFLQLGVFTPLMRNHSAIHTRDQEIYRFSTWEKMRDTVTVRYALLPFLYSEFMKAALSDGLYFRPLAFDWSDDPRACRVEDQLLLGESCMIAPVLEPNALGRSVYLPEDMLMIRFRSAVDYDLIPLEKGDHYVELALHEFPLFVRKNRFVLLCPGGESAETLDDTRLTALGWIPDGAAYDYYRDDGTDPCPSADQITRITAAAGPSLRRSFTAPKDFPECRIPDPAE